MLVLIPDDLFKLSDFQSIPTAKCPENKKKKQKKTCPFGNMNTAKEYTIVFTETHCDPFPSKLQKLCESTFGIF